jgi:hypothetical protein
MNRPIRTASPTASRGGCERLNTRLRPRKQPSDQAMPRMQQVPLEVMDSSFSRLMEPQRGLAICQAIKAASRTPRGERKRMGLSQRSGRWISMREATKGRLQNMRLHAPTAQPFRK